MRSSTIATYALCGYGSLCDLGIAVGAMAALAPNRRAQTSNMVVRALLLGNSACWLTGCIAGTVVKVTLYFFRYYPFHDGSI